MRTAGIHHVTAIAGDAQDNFDFYGGVLGMRLVKRTVNFDDPGTWHVYFGDTLGRPGTLVTFFPWALARRARTGAGQTQAIALAIPAGSLGWWRQRLTGAGVDVATVERFGAPRLAFADGDGMALELVERDTSAADPWRGGPVPVAHAIAGVDGVSLLETNPARTAEFLTGTLGLQAAGASDGRLHFTADAAATAPGAHVELVPAAGAPHGTMGRGAIHHVAFRAADDAEQRAWQQRLLDAHVAPTAVQERQYFRSIYFREPGGVLFELATEGPGFATDETPDALGTALQLPPWLEEARGEIVRALPPLAATPRTPELRGRPAGSARP